MDREEDVDQGTETAEAALNVPPADAPEDVSDVRVPFSSVFPPGTNTVVVGPRGSGKSSFGAGLANTALKWKDWVVASNVPCHRYDGALEQFVIDYPERYYYVDNYYHLLNVDLLALKESVRMLRAGQIHEIGDGIKVLFVMDEGGAMGETYRKGESAVKPAVQDSIAFMSVTRHLNVATVVVSQSLENVGAAYREFGGGLLDWVVEKPSRWARHVARFVDRDGNSEELFVKPRGIARGTKFAMEHPGEIVYIDAISGFEFGTYPGTRIPFRLRELLHAMKGRDPTEYPGVIEEFLRTPDWHVSSQIARSGPAVNPASRPPSGAPGKRPYDFYKPQIMALFEMGETSPVRISRQLGCHLNTVKKFKRQWVADRGSGAPQGQY